MYTSEKFFLVDTRKKKETERLLSIQTCVVDSLQKKETKSTSKNNVFFCAYHYIFSAIIKWLQRK